MKFLKKYHKWLSIILTVFIIMFAVSGIVLNHRETFSPFEVSREALPEDYQYNNWNNAALLSSLQLSNDSFLVYGNIGIWATDSSFKNYSDFNKGFPNGIDNRKITSVVRDAQRNLFAGSFFGLYKFNDLDRQWQKVELPVKEKRITDLIIKEDSLFILTRSFLLKSNGKNNFEVIELPKPQGYTNTVGLFKTLWVIHSGEIYGLIGKLLVDIVAVIFMFLSISGLVLFINRRRIKLRNKIQKQVIRLKSVFKWNLKWHNKIGWTTLIILVITTFTGMFLRPPLLAFIGNAQVGKIPYTKLDSANPWFDKLRRITYDDDENRFLVSTLDGIYYSDDDFKSELNKFRYQPPVSVMGVTVLRKTNPNTYLIGSFQGLYEWNYATGFVLDYIKKVPYTAPLKHGPPIGEFKISGYTNDFLDQEIIFDYDFGAASITQGRNFPQMPEEIVKESPISLWNFALEIHTARLYKIFMSDYYILFIPLSGIMILFILISGFVVWLKIRKRK